MKSLVFISLTILTFWNFQARASGQQIAVQVTSQSQSAVQAPLNRPVTIKLSNEMLSDAVRVIARAAGVNIFFTEELLPAGRRVNLDARSVSARDALQSVLRGTDLYAVVSPSGDVALAKRSSRSSRLVQGVITGKVIDSKSEQGISGANVSITADNRAAVTGEDGSYRLAGVPAGIHMVSVRSVGYAKVAKSITVGEGATVTANFSLERSANVLDQVIVTGTIVQTELRAVPNAVTVITAKQIEERGITRVDHLFRGDVPGLFAMNDGASPFAVLGQVTTFTRGASKLDDGENPPSTPIKTYVDGVELSNPSFLSQIDPKSIERIEILTGPQASTIYGSNAINGVMQIFTKRGTLAKRQLDVSLLSGFVQNNFSSTLTPQHDHSAQLSGSEGKLLYHLGSSWNYLGPWTPNRQTDRLDVHGGGRIQLNSLTADISLRRGMTTNRARAGESGQPIKTAAGEGVYRANLVSAGGTPHLTSTLQGRTLGFTLVYTPTRWWVHELASGTDVVERGEVLSEPAHTAPFDTLLFYSQSPSQRVSHRSTSTVRIPFASRIGGVFSLGADHWQTRSSRVSAEGSGLTGSLSSPSVRRDRPDKNMGLFLQGQMNFGDAFFVTYGARAEWNPNYGHDAQPNIAPRYGIAYTRDLGLVTAKVRASYGRSTRPPVVALKLAMPLSPASTLLPTFGQFDEQLANPDLGPEFQQGGEGGIEVYFANRGSLVVTRYNQIVDGIIANVVVDSVRSLQQDTPDCAIQPDGYCYFGQMQNLNLGSIRNQGWELQGSVKTGSLTTRGTYSWVKSRMIGIAPQYRAQFSANSAYQPGATFTYVPEHIWAMNMTYSSTTTTVSANVTGMGPIHRNFRDDFILNLLFSRLDMNKLRAGIPEGYRGVSRGYRMMDINASRSISGNVDGILQIQNLTDFYRNDFSAQYASIGRQLKTGVRIHW